MSHYTVFLLSSDTIGWGDLRHILSQLPNIRVVSDVSNPSEVRYLAAKQPPDLIVATETINGNPTISLLTDLHRRFCPASKIIMLAPRCGSSQLPPPDSGVIMYLWSDLPCAVLGRTLAAVIMDDVVLSTHMTVTGLGDGLCAVDRCKQTPKITSREQSVLKHLADGLSRLQIAQAELLSSRTVDRIVASLEQKLEAPNQFVLAKRAAQLRLIN